MSGRGLSSLGFAPRAECGIALIVTLFIVALLTVLVLEYHFDAVIELDMAANYADDVRAHHLALAGVQFARVLLQVDDKLDSDGPEDLWSITSLIPTCTPPQQLLELVAAAGALSGSPQSSPSPFDSESSDNRDTQETQSDEGCVSLHIIDESGKLPINALTFKPPGTSSAKSNAQKWKFIFQKFFESFGINNPEDVVGALIDWIDENNDEEPGGGAEESYYSSLATPYKIPNAPMSRTGELRLIKGFDIDTLSKLLPDTLPQAIADTDLGSNEYLTPHSEMSGVAANQLPKVNFNTANKEVMQALIDGVGGSPCIAQDISLERKQKQFQKLTDITSCNAASLTQFADVKSAFFRIEAVGKVGAIKKKVVAVVKRAASGATPGATTMKYFKIE